ncbi:MAG: ABC transporter permease [Thermomicrobiales bacterium]|nr:ABC transporter permease [Thermomicrobiales bacterium]
MGRYLLRRILISIPVLFGISIATYAFLNFAPGDPVTAMLNPQSMATLGPDWVDQRREALGLNDPVYVRYGKWLGQVAQGNLGYSYRDGQPVTHLIGERVWPTVKLMSMVVLLSIVIGIPLGVLAAIKQYSWIDYLSAVFGFGAVSVPSFFLALGLIYIFALKLQWLPVAGMNTVGQTPTFTDSLRHLVLPTIALGLAQAAPLIRYTRSSMLESIKQDYVQVARAKGLSERVVMLRHALRNVLIPLVTVIALDLPILFGGTVIVEQIFAWPGMGQLAITAVLGRDYPVIMGITLIGAAMIVACNLLADFIYALVDPRIKYS